ncbi:MAG TPA: cytochrome D1 domain-containing protein [Steroidobacteraceae bacterium]|nr:cytochrome D1 domain-containing protein [Steroidobacteraceae bacterium]
MGRSEALWLGILAAAALAGPAEAARLYVSNEDGQSVTVLDTETGAAIETIAIGKRPRGLKLNADGSRLFVAVSGLPKCPPSVPDEECAKLERDLKADGIAVVDTATHKVVKVLHAGSDPEQFALSRDGKKLFVANEDSATLSVVDIANGTVVQRVPVGREPEGVAVTPDGRYVLVTNESDNSVSIIDTGTLKIVKSVQVGKRPRDIAFTPDGRTAYVSGEFDASVYRMSVPEGAPVERVLELRKEARPMGILLDSARNRLYVSTGRGGTVAVIDSASHKLIAEVQVGTRPWGIALSQDGRWLYTANGPSDDVTVIDTSTLSAVRHIRVGRSPWGVAVANSGSRSSGSQPATAVRLGLGFPIALRHLLRGVGVAEDPAALAGEGCVLRVGRSLNEFVVAQAVGDAVDGT